MVPPLSASAHPRHSGLSLPLIVGVMSGTFHALSQGATVTEAIVGGVMIAAIVGLGTWWLRQPALVHRHTPILARWFRIPPPAKVTWDDPQVVDRDVYLPITNGGGTSQFSASVERVDGTADAFPIPFAIRWAESSGERRQITRDATQRLYLAHVEPEGDIEKYPIAYGQATKASVKRLRHYKPGRFRFMGLQGQEHVVYLDLRDVGWGTRMAERYKRQLRVVVRVRSADGAVNEATTVVLRIRESKKPKRLGEGYAWGKDDEVVAEIESSGSKSNQLDRPSARVDPPSSRDGL